MAKREEYSVISIIQLVASILVIVIHCGRLFENDVAHFVVKTTIARLAVPIFFITSGFFVKGKMDSDERYFSLYTSQKLKDYLFWTIIYLPYGFLFVINEKISLELIPLVLIGGLLIFGTCYHLWYYPALLLGILMNIFLRRHTGVILTFIIVFLLYCVGALETYSAYLQEGPIQDIYGTLKGIFQTTRNGLFFSPIFLFLGMSLYDYRKCDFFKNKIGAKIIFSTILLLVESIIIFKNQGDDKNFLFALIPLSLFIVNWGVQTKLSPRIDLKYVRSMSKYIFLIHPIILEVVRSILWICTKHTRNGILLFSLTLIITWIVVSIHYRIHEHRAISWV